MVIEMALGDGLVLWYIPTPWDTERNKVYDRSGNRNHGALYNGVGIDYDSVSGKPVWSFDGVDDYMEVSYNEIFDITDAITVGVLFRKTTTWSDHFRNLVGKPTYNPSYGIIIEWYEGNPTNWNIYSGGSRNAIAGPTTSLNEWVYAVGTYDSSTGDMYYYYNGEQVNHANIGAGSKIDVHTYSIRISHASYPFPGHIGEVRIYNRVLTDGEINLLWRLAKARLGL